MSELIEKKRTEAKVFMIARLFIDRPDREFELVKAVIYRCCEEIDKQPTIKSKPVRHGRMIEGRYPNENKCSECGKMFRDDIGFIIQDEGGVFHYPKRCPECGCYWDGGADNDKT